jgi:hypothetical protein
VCWRSAATVPGRAILGQVSGGWDRPLLFLDVDGPLLPFAASGSSVAGRASLRIPAELQRAVAANPLLARLNPEHGRWLSALPCQLVWATTWMTDANEVISPLPGLPELPVVDWPDDDDEPGSVHWKTRGLTAWADGRRFIWVDDEITNADRVWVRAYHPSPALLHRVDPRRGLTRRDIAAITDWLAPPTGADHRQPSQST